MSIDFDKCEICTPTGERLQSMNETLWKLFPYDRPIYNELIKGRRFYTLTNYALYYNDEFIGNAGLFPVSIWLDGKIKKMIGIAAVVTVPKYRKQGVAKYLMNYCMEIIDREQKSSILFTELPDVYKSHGFVIIEQHYMSAKSSQIRFGDHGLTRKYLEQLSGRDIEMIRWIYNDFYPNYDGKILRTKKPDYYDLYEMFFNLYPKPRLVLCLRGNDIVGYMRFDVEHDRLTITELCAAPEADDTLKSLLGFAGEFARLTGFDSISFALPTDHLAWDVLRKNHVELLPEPDGVRREIFMVRPAKGQPINEFASLQWSLADKF